ncbi:ketopantoate reductase family protein [Micropruina sonneratiae]|uniref:ketopantoate reductase family protein n=1 Tax=Micropruina sonneratiae TaxID=2986940 RepID=UPI0022274BB4|nr:ketopantoate reductase family protein [Micropruina sp. KQZ13P-5]MCW3158537.1 ketopantoate reductase family protein [Micropruina sp. KQZ13P-5]
MRFLFLGAGAIGTYVGGSLAAAGEDVTFIERPETAALIAEHGLRIRTADRTQVVTEVTVHGTAAEALAAGPYDIGVFALKSFDTGTALAELLATGHDVPTILSLQNGVDNEATIAAALGADRVLAGTVATAVSKPGVGEVVEEKHRGIGVALGHRLSEELVAALDRAGLSGKPFADAGSMKWSKLLTNLTGNATSAILDRSVAELFADKSSYGIEVAVLRECLAVMKALGHRVVDLPGTPVRALALATRLPRFIAQPALTRALGAGRGDKMPSFHIDLHGGRGRTEVSFLNGAVARHGEAAGVPTPVNALLTSTLEALSAGDLPIDTYRHDPDALLARL